MQEEENEHHWCICCGVYRLLHGVIELCPLCTYNLVRPVRIALSFVLLVSLYYTVLKTVHSKSYPHRSHVYTVYYSLLIVGLLCTSTSIVVLPIMRFVPLSTGRHTKALKTS